jgi:hypothetical protein
MAATAVFGPVPSRPRSPTDDLEEAGLLSAFNRSRSPSESSASTDGDAEVGPPSGGQAAFGAGRCSLALTAGAVLLVTGTAVSAALCSMGRRGLHASVSGLAQKDAVTTYDWGTTYSGGSDYSSYDASASAGAETASSWNDDVFAGTAGTTTPAGSYDYASSYDYAGTAAAAGGYGDTSQAQSASAAYGGGYGYGSEAAVAGADDNAEEAARAGGAYGGGYGYEQQAESALSAAPGYLDTSVKAVPEMSTGGPKEFTGSGGPETIAGTKLVEAGLEDMGAEEVYTHPPEPLPDEDYADENPPMEFYVYRAQSDQNYPMRNANLGDLEGVMWYLHNEIVGFPDPDYKIRHFNISRIIRFKASIQNPPEWFRERRTKFGPYQAYNAGKCSNNQGECDSYYRYGGVVGCQETAQEVAAYLLPDGRAPLWYSLPGPCPTHEYGAKSQECIEQSPGGDCGKGNDVTGAKDCTFKLEWAGEVRLDDFLPPTQDGYQTDLVTFLSAGGREYDKDGDQGVGANFWDGIHDPDACSARVDAVLDKFEAMYPRRPASIGEPPECDNISPD